jgi:hypothetical protein
VKRLEREPASGDTMLPDVEYRQNVLRMQPPGDPEAGRRPRFRESLDTLLLGALSTSIGVVLLIALASGIARRPIPGWSERAISASASYYIPSKDCGIAAVVGVFLGMAGILLGRWRHGMTSPLSALGTIISLVHVYLFFIYVTIMELL